MHLKNLNSFFPNRKLCVECVDLASENTLIGAVVSSTKDFLPGGAVALSQGAAHMNKGLSDIQLSLVYLKPKQETNKLFA